MDDMEKMKSEGLPSKDSFYSTLYESHVSDEDYQRAQRVWSHFNMKTMKDYHDLYLETDVLLLADVFENFRRTCIKSYELDPAHYVSAPGLCWDAFLKRSGKEIELVSDMDMFQFFEKGMRGGTSYIGHRHSTANNKYMEEYNEDEESRYLMYLDANNLYGWAMSQPLPCGEFEWVKNTDNINLDDYINNDGRGMVLEVDTEYPSELHDLHNGYPLAPESMKIKPEMLSKYARDIAEKFKLTVGGVHMLVTSLGSKKKYVVHVRNLKLYTDLGKKLTKVHRAVTFKQSCWLKDYIAFNTKMRSTAKNTFEKNFFKLMNNSIYGKTMENLRKRVDIKLVSSEDAFLKLVASPCFQSHRIMNENLIAVKGVKKVLTLNKPCYVGMCILDLSKTLMYDFHYNTIKKEYGDNAKLLFTDTDSLMYEIKTDDVYKDFKRIGEKKDCWDNSDYPKDSPYYSAHNKKVIGKFKDEAEGVPIKEFVGLRSKMYSYVKENGKGGMTAKGVKKYVIKNKLTHDNFKNVIKKKDRMRHKMNTIRSTKHIIGTYEIQKVTLSCFDDKRYLRNDGVTSYAYGNRRIDNDTVEVPIVEACDSNKWVHTSEEYIVCEPVIYESKPIVAVVIEEETVRLNNPKVEYIEPYDLFFLKVITFRRAERKLGFLKISAQLQSFKWSTEKVTQYMYESENPLICEFNKEELDRSRKGLIERGRSEEEAEDEIRRKIYESKEKLIRRYEGYLGIREDTCGNQVRTYRRWLRDTKEYSDKNRGARK
jgi:hypothetical protein